MEKNDYLDFHLKVISSLCAAVNNASGAYYLCKSYFMNGIVEDNDNVLEKLWQNYVKLKDLYDEFLKSYPV